jgi:hypothetical protein
MLEQQITRLKNVLSGEVNQSASVTVHELKTWPVLFDAIINGEKTFEVRKNDRDFRSGDVVLLREFDPSFNGYTGRARYFTIGFVLEKGFGLEEGYCAFSLIGGVNVR